MIYNFDNKLYVDFYFKRIYIIYLSIYYINFTLNDSDEISSVEYVGKDNVGLIAISKNNSISFEFIFIIVVLKESKFKVLLISVVSCVLIVELLINL